jgi:hypothetical protein
MAKAKPLKYPCPSPDNPEFLKMWGILLPEVCERGNFKKVHLYQLELLCDLYCEYKRLTTVLEISGMTYSTSGRAGDLEKPRPELLQLNKVRADIAVYSKMLGILLNKDTGTSTDAEEKQQWE